MLVDALSRLSDTSLICINEATVEAVSKWGSLISKFRQSTHTGFARVGANIGLGVAHGP